MDFIPDINGRLMAIQALASTLPSIKDPSLFQQRLTQIISHLRFLNGEHPRQIDNIKERVVSLLTGNRTETSLSELIREINTLRSQHIGNIDSIKSQQRADEDVESTIEYDEEDRICIINLYPTIKLFRSVIEQIEIGQWGKSMFDAKEVQSTTFSMYLPVVALLNSLSNGLDQTGLCMDNKKYEDLSQSWKALCIPREMLPYLVEYYVRDEEDFASYSEGIPAEFRSIILNHTDLWKRIFKEGTSHLNKATPNNDRMHSERDLYYALYPRILSIASKPIQEDERLCHFAYCAVEDEKMTLDQARELFEKQTQRYHLTTYVPLLQFLILKYLKTDEHKVSTIRSWLDKSKTETHVIHSVLIGTILNARDQIDVKKLLEFITDIDEMCISEGWRMSCYKVLFLYVCITPSFEDLSSLTDLVPYTFKNKIKLISFTSRLEKEIQQNGGDCNIIFKYLSFIPESLRCHVLTSLAGSIVKSDIMIAFDLLKQLHRLEGFEKLAGVLIEHMGKTLSVYGRALSNLMVIILQKTKGEERTVVIQELVDRFRSNEQPLDMIEHLLNYLSGEDDKTSRVTILTVVCIQALTETSSDNVLAILKRLVRFASDEPLVINNMKQISAQAFFIATHVKTIHLQLRIATFRVELEPDNYEVMEQDLVPLYMKPEIKDFEKALSTIDVCLNHTHKEEDLQYRKAFCLYMLGRHSEALQITSQYVAKTELFDFFILHSKTLLILNKFQEALPFALKVLEKNDDVVLLEYVADYYFNKHKNIEALGFLERLLRISPSSEGFCNMKLQALLRCKKFKEAYEFSFKVLERDPGNHPAIIAQYHFHMQTREYMKALEVMKPFEAQLESLALPVKLNVFICLSNIYYRLFEYEKALKLLMQAENIVPKYKVKIADILHQLGRNEEALQFVEKGMLQKPNDAEAYRLRAVIYLTSGHFEQSLSDINRYFELDGDDECLHLLSISLLIYLKKYPEALRHFEGPVLSGVILKKKFVALAALIKGQVHFIKNDFVVAKELLREAIREYDADAVTKHSRMALFNRNKAKEWLDMAEALIGKAGNP